MKTVDKALALLNHFSVKEPELGLTEIARHGGLDKATALRLLTSLRKNGFVEQDARTKRYRLGTALLRLSRVREASFPVVRIIQPILDRLAKDSGETAHSALLVADRLASIAIAESDRATRVFVYLGGELPFHATATGTAILAFSPPDVAKRLIETSPKAYTGATLTDRAAIEAAVKATRERGYALASGSYEAEVVSVGAPLFDEAGVPVGGVSVACVASRWAPEREAPIARMVTAAAVEATRGMGGEPSRAFLAAAQALGTARVAAPTA